MLWLIMVTLRQHRLRLHPAGRWHASWKTPVSPCMQGSAYWEVAAGYVGALSADIPLTSLGSDPVSLRVEEALITVCPRPGTLNPDPNPTSTGGDGGGGGAPGEGGGGAGSPSAGDLEALGQAAVVDGVRLIAGGIEDVLQRLRIQVPFHFKFANFAAGMRVGLR